MHFSKTVYLTYILKKSENKILQAHAVMER